MAFPSRRTIFMLAIMLAIMLTIAVAIGVIMLRPGSLSAVEQGLVGTWDVRRPSDQSKQAALVFEADREVRLVDGTLLGQWRISGSELILVSANLSPLGKFFAAFSGPGRTASELNIAPEGNRFTVKQFGGGDDAVLTRTPTE